MSKFKFTAVPSMFEFLQMLTQKETKRLESKAIEGRDTSSGIGEGKYYIIPIFLDVREWPAKFVVLSNFFTWNREDVPGEYMIPLTVSAYAGQQTIAPTLHLVGSFFTLDIARFQHREWKDLVPGENLEILANRFQMKEWYKNLGKAYSLFIFDQFLELFDGKGAEPPPGTSETVTLTLDNITRKLSLKEVGLKLSKFFTNNFNVARTFNVLKGLVNIESEGPKLVEDPRPLLGGNLLLTYKIPITLEVVQDNGTKISQTIFLNYSFKILPCWTTLWNTLPSNGGYLSGFSETKERVIVSDATIKVLSLSSIGLTLTVSKVTQLFSTLVTKLASFLEQLSQTDLRIFVEFTDLDTRQLLINNSKSPVGRKLLDDFSLLGVSEEKRVIEGTNGRTLQLSTKQVPFSVKVKPVTQNFIKVTYGKIDASDSEANYYRFLSVFGKTTNSRRNYLQAINLLANTQQYLSTYSPISGVDVNPADFQIL